VLYALDNFRNRFGYVDSGLQLPHCGRPNSPAACGCARNPDLQPGNRTKARSLRPESLRNFVSDDKWLLLRQSKISTPWHLPGSDPGILCRVVGMPALKGVRLSQSQVFLSRLQPSKLRSRRAPCKYATERLERL